MVHHFNNFVMLQPQVLLQVVKLLFMVRPDVLIKMLPWLMAVVSWVHILIVLIQIPLISAILHTLSRLLAPTLFVFIAH
jgi:hypothetical protein